VRLHSHEQVSARRLAELRDEADIETRSRFIDPSSAPFVA
jgi:hypothetical protein